MPSFQDRRKIEGNNGQPDLIMGSETVFIVTGVRLLAELLDRSTAGILSDAIDRRGVGDMQRSLVISDALWLNDPSLHDNPVISIGGPDSNALTVELLKTAKQTWGDGVNGAFDPGPPPKAALWGYDSNQTWQSVEKYICQADGLAAYLSLIWK